MSVAPTLLLSPVNVSEGRDPEAIRAIADAFASTGGARVLDVHSDPDHHRSVISLAGAPGRLAEAILAGAQETIRRIDLLGREGLPVLLYGALAGGRTRAELRRGGPAELDRRLRTGELKPDFGPPTAHPTAGAVLVAARPPLVAFNLELAPPAGVQDARRIAARVREGGEEGLPGVRAIGLELPARGGVAQVSCNVEDHEAVPLARLLAAVAAHARVTGCELVGLAPAAAFDGFPDDVPVENRRTVESALDS